MATMDIRLLAASIIASVILVALCIIALSKPNKHTTDIVRALISTLTIVVTFLVCGMKAG